MTDHSRTIVQMRDVSKVYVTGNIPFVALRNVNLAITAGEFLGITGKSGAGKTTLLNMLSGVSRVSSGEVLFCAPRGKEALSIHSLSENEMALWRGRNIGVIYQSFELLPQLSLIDNVMLPMDLCGLYKPRKSLARAKELLTQVGLQEHMRKPPTRISGGLRQPPRGGQ